MVKPNLKEEKRLWRNGYKRIAGLDEAGRGPLAGPVVAGAAVIIIAKVRSQKSKIKTRAQGFKILLKEVRDSKELSLERREELYKIIVSCPVIEWGTGKVSARVIDKINILEATKLAMTRAIRNLEKKSGQVDFLILDGKMKLNLALSQKSIVKADQKVFSCAAASILAKVARDRMMRKYHQKYPRYGFWRHKGYPTKFHFKMLKKYGPSLLHRRTFRPIKKR